VQFNHCLRCGKDWAFRGTGRALRCGQCGSPYWDRERVRGFSKRSEVPGADSEQRIPASGLRVPKVSLPVAPVRGPAKSLSALQGSGVGRSDAETIETDEEHLEQCQDRNCRRCRAIREKQ
jgi:DNA-directed RNA polymerase subunit RPC12/RpoP